MMPKTKVSKVDLAAFVSRLEEDDKVVEQYQIALRKLDITSTSFNQLSTKEQFGVVVSKYGFLEVCRIQRAIEVSDVSSSFNASIFSETLGADVNLCEFLLSARLHLNVSAPSAASASPIDPSLNLASGSPIAASSASLTKTSSSTCPLVSCISYPACPEDSLDFCLLPPYSSCISCNRDLSHNHDAIKVTVVTLTGSKNGRKTTLRCRHCSLTYRYDCYGNPTVGYKLYKKSRQFVKASNTFYVERQLFELQCSLANHAWVSFVGFAESYNDTFNLTRHTGLNYKQVSSAFFSGELENELRALNRLDMFNLMRVDSDQEKVLVEVEKLRRKQPYPHENCHPACQAKGCGRVFAVDGIWKLRFPHCMYKVKSVVSKIEIPGLPDVCTNVPLRGKAFCQAHCTVAEKSDIPTGIREFLKHCGVQVADTIKSDTGEGRTRTHLDVEDRDSTHVDESEEELDCLTDSPVEDSTIRNVDAVLSSVNASLDGSSVVDAQGTSSFIEENSQQMPAIMAGCEEENPMSCRKDTGGRKSLQKWSRGHLFIVRAGGHIEYWQSLYRSESPSQVFLILLAWLAIHLKGISPTEWSKLSLVYDNMCHLDNMRVARKPLPLPWPWSHMWMLPKKCIDRLHIRNHTDDGCKAKYHPDNHLVSGDNTLCCEQTFVWLSRYKKIVCAMPKSHHLFYLHRMVSRRNAYTNLCYLRGYNPILPVVKNAKTT